jgi:hypothetical protein
MQNIYRTGLFFIPNPPLFCSTHLDKQLKRKILHMVFCSDALFAPIVIVP